MIIFKDAITGKYNVKCILPDNKPVCKIRVEIRSNSSDLKRLMLLERYSLCRAW